MRLIAQTLVVFIALNLLAPVSGVAQQRSAENMSQLRVQIAKLEKIDADPETSPEVKSINCTFLSERRAELNALMRKISALRQCLPTAGEALRADDRRVVEQSIRALLEELGETRPEARDTALAATSPAVDIPSSIFVRANADSRNNYINTGALFSFSRSVPELQPSTLSKTQTTCHKQ